MKCGAPLVAKLCNARQTADKPVSAKARIVIVQHDRVGYSEDINQIILYTIHSINPSQLHLWELTALSFIMLYA